jgi:hypothetical protein
MTWAVFLRNYHLVNFDFGFGFRNLASVPNKFVASGRNDLSSAPPGHSKTSVDT